MSAFFAAAYDGRVEILTDGATYDESGVIVKLGQKVWTSDRAPIAFAGRGNHVSVSMLGAALQIMSYSGSFDETFMRFKEKIEARRDMDVPMAGAVDGIVAGISETLGPVIYYFHTYQGEERERLANIDPFTFVDMGKEAGGGTDVTPREMRDSGLPCYFFLDDLLEHGPTFFELMRRKQMSPLTHPHLPPVHGIGGHVDWTVVMPNASATLRIYEWPDEIGARIDPSAPGRATSLLFEDGASVEDAAA